MTNKIFRKVGLAVVLIGTSGLAIAQDGTATVQPAIQIVGQDQVLNTCSEIAPTACTSDTNFFLTSFSPDVPSQTLADFVVAMVGVTLEDPVCTEIDFQIADALDISAEFAGDVDQRDQIKAIAEALRLCQDVVTAALPLAASPG